jgi:hypothetical protein
VRRVEPAQLVRPALIAVPYLAGVLRVAFSTRLIVQCSLAVGSWRTPSPKGTGAQASRGHWGCPAHGATFWPPPPVGCCGLDWPPGQPSPAAQQVATARRRHRHGRRGASESSSWGAQAAPPSGDACGGRPPWGTEEGESGLPATAPTAQPRTPAAGAPQRRRPVTWKSLRRVRRAGRPTPANDSYLVDSASSHMLVSKIKPCMSKYKQLYSETANGSLYKLSFI